MSCPWETKQRLGSFFQQALNSVTYPKWKAYATLGKTITSANEKAPTGYEPAATFKQKANERNAAVNAVCVCVCAVHSLLSTGNPPRV